jgi:biopolymer transport protein ExbD
MMSAFHHEEAAQDISLNLTALMDILSNLLFFLLASYTAQAMEVQQKDSLHLPASSSQVKLAPNLTLTVSKKQILVADVPVATISGDQILGTKVEPDDKIVNLYDRLRNARSLRANAGSEGTASTETVLLLADRTIDSTIITKVLKTAGMAGFVNIRFGVLAK